MRKRKRYFQINFLIFILILGLSACSNSEAESDDEYLLKSLRHIVNYGIVTDPASLGRYLGVEFVPREPPGIYHAIIYRSDVVALHSSAGKDLRPSIGYVLNGYKLGTNISAIHYYIELSAGSSKITYGDLTLNGLFDKVCLTSSRIKYFLPSSRSVRATDGINLEVYTSQKMTLEFLFSGGNCAFNAHITSK